jgi:hypothetical protein
MRPSLLMGNEVITVDAATARLLGQQCDKCRYLFAAPVTASAAPTVPAGTIRHSPTGCTVCQIAQLAAAKRRAHRSDAELLNMAARRDRPHDPLPGPRPNGLAKARDGSWRLQYPKGHP